jgi:hypothetical protein
MCLALFMELKSEKFVKAGKNVSNSLDGIQNTLCVSKCDVNGVVTNKLRTDMASSSGTNFWVRTPYIWIRLTDLWNAWVIARKVVGLIVWRLQQSTKFKHRICGGRKCKNVKIYCRTLCNEHNGIGEQESQANSTNGLLG